ncbi:hypothetical protein POM88_043733 [Heracleum sosnowskyi]|uniref:Nucleolar protein 58/56 N-terminal domain-containing protein n=1 Tax=Heracleum sosnowskyi TaxID=360622 RepID=A0AAD8H2M2_9APIA|nr:hypothetical protein POM88_043733 [Heracleum sosnowskyi]
MLTAYAPQRRKRERDDDADDEQREITLGDISIAGGRNPLPIHLLFECATGYALFHARGIHQVGMDTFQSVENYLNQSEQPFKLESYLPFSSDEDALTQMKAISSSLLTPQLLNFIKDSLPQPKTAGSRHSITTLDPQLAQMITSKTRLGLQYGVLTQNVMRGLRMKIHEFIGLTRGELENAQLNLARLYINQMLPGETLYGEELVRVQNVEDTVEVEVEYRVWNLLRSKLGAAILSGVTNIWIKPGSRVLYIGNVCGLTVSELSDLVGSDGLVYVVGLSDDVVDMAGNRPNSWWALCDLRTGKRQRFRWPS